MAQKPEAPEWLIENIAEASKNARKIYFLYIGFLAYCALTVVSTSDRQIILNETVSLPILKIDVSLDGFFLLAPLIAIFVFAYFQLYLKIRKKLISRLERDAPSIEEEHLYPWMLVALDFPGRAFIDRLQAAIVKFSVWYSLPLVLALISTWFVKKHDPILSYIIGLAPIAGTVVVLWFWCQYEDVKFKFPPFLRKKFLHVQYLEFDIKNWGKNVLLLVVIAYEVIFLSFIIPMANEGFPQITRDTKGYLKYLKSWFCVNLSYENLVTEPKRDYKGLYWGNFNEAHLEGARLVHAALERADLRNANLSNTVLNSAILEKADLSESNLQKVKLWRANLKGADLEGTNLQGANLVGANFQGASLEGAFLQGAKLWLAKGLTPIQLSKVKTLYMAGLDLQLKQQINNEYPNLLKAPTYVLEEPKED